MQQFYFTNTTKYLSKRGNIYYFTKRFGNKVYKLSLKSSDLDFCKLQRDKIMRNIMEHNVNDIDFKNLAKSTYTISLDVKPDLSKGETEEGARMIAAEFGKKLMQDVNPSNLEEFLMLNKNSNTPAVQEKNTKLDLWNEIWDNIDKYLEKFIKDKIKQNRISTNTQKNMEASFKYLKLFCVNGVIPDLQLTMGSLKIGLGKFT